MARRPAAEYTYMYFAVMSGKCEQHTSAAIISVCFGAWVDEHDTHFSACVNSGVGSNLQVVGAQCRREAPAEIFLMCPPLFSCAPHMRGHNDCLLPTERQLK